MQKKILLIILTFFLIISYAPAWQPCVIKGTYIKVYAKVPLTTQSLEEGSRVYFVVPADIWVLEQKAIEKGDIFQGYVSMLKLPVQGVNAAMQIDITDLIKKNGDRLSVKGKIIYKNSNIIGGNLTNPASYNTTIHPRKVYGNNWGGTLQYVPSGEYEFGQHVTITSKDSIFVELEDDLFF